MKQGHQQLYATPVDFIDSKGYELVDWTVKCGHDTAGKSMESRANDNATVGRSASATPTTIGQDSASSSGTWGM